MAFGSRLNTSLRGFLNSRGAQQRLPGAGAAINPVSPTGPALPKAAAPAAPAPRSPAAAPYAGPKPIAKREYKNFSEGLGQNITGNAPRISQYLAANQERLPGLIRSVASADPTGQRGQYTGAESRLDRSILTTASARDLDPQNLVEGAQALTQQERDSLSDEGIRRLGAEAAAAGGRVGGAKLGLGAGSLANVFNSNRGAVNTANAQRLSDARAQQADVLARQGNIADLAKRNARQEALGQNILNIREAILGGKTGVLDTAVRGAFQTGAEGTKELAERAVAGQEPRIKTLLEEGRRDELAVQSARADQAALQLQKDAESKAAKEQQVKARRNQLAAALAPLQGKRYQSQAVADQVSVAALKKAGLSESQAKRYIKGDKSVLREIGAE